MFRTIRTNFDRRETRRDRRYPLPSITVTFAEGSYETLNWSLGGFLLSGGPSDEVGTILPGVLHVGEATFPFTAEVVRRDEEERAVAFHFIEPSPRMVSALDRVVAERLMGRRAIRSMILAMLGVALASPAIAGGPTKTGGPGESTLVRGDAPLPEFHLDFPSLSGGVADSLANPSDQDLEISLTAPGKGPLHFLFSPRSQFGLSLNNATGTSRSYAGLTWNIFDSDGIFGNIGLAGSVTHPGADDPATHLMEPSLTMHGMLELGYRFGGQHSLSLSLDHARPLDPFSAVTDRGDLGDNLRLRYGYRF
jgi:hypothetical protein